MTKEVIAQLNKLAQIQNEVQCLTNNRKPFGNTEKQTLFLTYLDIDKEHLRSLHLLISNDLNGSAFALVRTFYETFFRALWVNAYAKDEELEKIRNGKFKFNNMGTKIKSLDKKYNTDDFFTNLKLGVWEIMADYTHSGAYQLSRRFKDGKLEENYTESEVLEVIVEVTEAYLLFTYTLFKIHGYTEEENETLEILKKYREDTHFLLERF